MLLDFFCNKIRAKKTKKGLNKQAYYLEIREQLEQKLQGLEKKFICFLEARDKKFNMGTYILVCANSRKFLIDNEEIISAYNSFTDNEKLLSICKQLDILNIFELHLKNHCLDEGLEVTYDNIVFYNKTARYWYISQTDEEGEKINKELEEFLLVNLKDFLN